MDQTFSYRQHVPKAILDRYEFLEVRNAAAIIAATNPDEWKEILDVLENFSLDRNDILSSGGNKSDVARRLDEAFRISG